MGIFLSGCHININHYAVLVTSSWVQNYNPADNQYITVVTKSIKIVTRIFYYISRYRPKRQSHAGAWRPGMTTFTYNLAGCNAREQTKFSKKELFHEFLVYK